MTGKFQRADNVFCIAVFRGEQLARDNFQAKSSIRTLNGSVLGAGVVQSARSLPSQKIGASPIRRLFASDSACSLCDNFVALPTVWKSEAGSEKLRFSDRTRAAQPFRFRPHRCHLIAPLALELDALGELQGGRIFDAVLWIDVQKGGEQNHRE